MGHTANNQNYKAHRNGIHQPRIKLKNLKRISLKGDDPKFLKNLKYVRKKHMKTRREIKRKSRHMRNNARRLGEVEWYKYKWVRTMTKRYLASMEPKPFKRVSKKRILKIKEESEKRRQINLKKKKRRANRISKIREEKGYSYSVRKKKPEEE